MAQTFTSFEEAAEAQKKYTPVFLGGFKNLSSQEDTVRFTGVFYGQTSNGKKFVWLEDELVVINKTTKKIIRIYLCGNIGRFTPFYKKPTESVIPLSQLTFYLKNLQLKGEKGDRGDKGERGYKGEKGDSFIQESGGSIFFPLSGGIVGGLIGGYGFPKETEIVTQTITPGTKVETGNSGTYLYGPQKIKTEIHTEKRFNWTGAAIGFGSGFILGYILNEVIF